MAADANIALATDYYPHAEAVAQAADGECVHILHGLFGSSSNWRSVARKLSAQRPIILADARNHGSSPWHAMMNYSIMAEDTAKLLTGKASAAPAGNKSVLIGHSMGGKTAMHISLARPDLVSKLVVVDIAPKAYAHSHHDALEAMRNLELHRIESRSQADSALGASILDTGVRQFLLQNLVKTGQPGSESRYTWRINLDAIAANMDALVGWNLTSDTQFKGPTLFIRGGLSDYVDQHDEALIRRYFPQATIETVDGAGHWPHAERAEQFMQKLNAFLA